MSNHRLMNQEKSYLKKTAIARQLGYFPAFLLPAINSSLILGNLMQQTLSAYVNNPLPDIFKEKLFVYLSRYFGVSYFTICHSCTLKSLGMSAAEILALETIAYPHTSAEITADLEVIQQENCDRHNWQHNPSLESSLLRCACLIFIEPSQATDCIEILKQKLGNVCYHYLVLLLGYIKFCHQWVMGNPEISYQQDRRTQLHLGALLMSESRLIEFLQANIHSEKIQSTLELPKQLAAPALLPSKSYLSLPPAEQPAPGSIWRSQRALTDCLANAPFPVMIHDREEQIVYLNRNWIEITGYGTSDIATVREWQQKAQVQQRDIVKLNLQSSTPQTNWRSPEMGTQTHNMLQEIAESLSHLVEEISQIEQFELSEQFRLGIKSEVSITTSEGKQRFWESYSAPLSLGDLDRDLTILMAKDITEVVEREAQLTKIETQLEMMQTAIEFGNLYWDFERNQVEISSRGLAILGLSNFDGSYASFLQSIHPTKRESIDFSFTCAIENHQDLELEYPILKSSYDIYSIQFSGKLRYNSHGKPVGLVGIFMERSQSKSDSLAINGSASLLSPKNLAFSTSSLKQVINLLPSYIYVTEIEGDTIILMNLKLSRSLNLPSPEIAQGKNIEEYFGSEYTKQLTWQHQQIITYNQELTIQQEVKLADGVHYFDTTITPLKDDREQIYALLHAANDIPDLAATQQALSQRTLQLEAANKELESFSYSVSHDLQAPLRVINGFSQVLWENYESQLDDRARHYLQRIQANSDRMSDLIDALLQLSRVTRSQMKLVRVNLSQIAQEILEEFQTREPKRQLEIAIASNLHAQGDPQLLRIVLNNLLNNAWKYTSKRSLGKIEFGATANPDNQIIYWVKDNGAGFETEYGDKLFTAFQRLHSQTEFPGTGIGLATVQRIIYRHGGKVWAEGESDRGAIFYFHLRSTINSES